MDSDAYLSREEYERSEDARRSALERLEELELGQTPTPLWRRLFREALCEGGECRDIVERHVLPKLNQTDVKFFYDVNAETRALIKSSSRERELEKVQSERNVIDIVFRVCVGESIVMADLVGQNGLLRESRSNE